VFNTLSSWKNKKKPARTYHCWRLAFVRRYASYRSYKLEAGGREVPLHTCHQVK